VAGRGGGGSGCGWTVVNLGEMGGSDNVPGRTGSHQEATTIRIQHCGGGRMCGLGGGGSGGGGIAAELCGYAAIIVGKVGKVRA
jgi:hypothetical protein